MQHRQTSQVTMMTKAMPPTTPPAIAPTFAFLDDPRAGEPEGPEASFGTQVVKAHDVQV